MFPRPHGRRRQASVASPVVENDLGGELDEIECVVVGAGVVGLATARALALAGQRVLVLERAPTIGFETSSRNSELIHGGL